MGRADIDLNALVDMRNFYYIGGFQQSLNEANKLGGSSNACLFFIYRSYIGQGKCQFVIDDIPQGLKSMTHVRYLAEYFAAESKDKRFEIMEEFKSKYNAEYFDVEDNDSMENQEMWKWTGATIYYCEGLYENALQMVHKCQHLELMALQVQCLLKMNRLDVAKKLFAQMQELDDDATLTQLVQAWINIGMGGEKLNDAYYIYQELMDRFRTKTVMLLNGQAVCALGMGKYDEAEELLREVLEKDSSNYDALYNMIFLSHCAENKGSDAINKYMSQLKSIPSAEFKELPNERKRWERELDNICSLYQPSNLTPVSQLIDS